MFPNLMLDRLRAGEVVLGLGNMYPAPSIIEGMCKGWDFVWIDGQHGQISYDTALSAVQVAAAAGLETLVRVPSHENCVLGPCADLAPSAVMVPMVDTAEQARAVVDGLCFPPLGKRSYGGRRVIDLYTREYYRQRELMVAAQIETLEAVSKVEEIIGTEGIDAVFFGPDDMKMRMNIPINTPPMENEQLRQAMEQTAGAARKAGKFAGTVAASGKSARIAVDLGYQFLIGGSDIAFLRNGAEQKLTEIRQAVAGDSRQTQPDQAAPEVYGR